MNSDPFLKVTKLQVMLLPPLMCCTFQSKVVPCLLRLRNVHNAAVAEVAREALALVGYVDTVSGRGIRVLSLDGGGTKYVPTAVCQ